MNFVVKQILVTGGAGFIGRNLVYRLVADGHAVTAIDNCATANSKYGRSWLNDFGIDVLEASVHDNDRLASLVKSHEIIIHCASAVGILETSASPTVTIEHLLPSRTIAGLTKKDQVIVFLSSSDIYGMHTLIYGNKPMQEDDLAVYESPQVRRWNYGRMKALSEVLISESSARTATIRIFNCYGPDLDYPKPSRVVPKFFHAVCSGDPIRISGNGRQLRSFCYIDDMVNGIVKVMRKLCNARQGVHEVFNIGNPHEQYTVMQLAELVAYLAVQHGISKNMPQIEYNQNCTMRSLTMVGIAFRTSVRPLQCWGMSLECPSPVVLMKSLNSIAQRKKGSRNGKNSALRRLEDAHWEN